MPRRYAARVALSTLLAVLALAAAWGGEAASAQKPAPPDPRWLEVEATAAAEARIYVVLDPDALRLEIKSRGIALDTVSLRAARVVRPAPLLGGGDSAPLELPALWRVTARGGRVSRELITPGTLQPYPEDDSDMPEPAAKEKEFVPPPASYLVGFDSGWALAVGEDLPATNFVARIGNAAADGWRRLWMIATPQAPAIAIAIDPADAQRLHHIFRKQTAVLVKAPAGVEEPAD